MDDFTFYFVFGLQHILSLNALDHVLFLGVLTAGYTFRQWKKLGLLVTAFTIGHCLTLALSVYELLQFPARLAEFFIPFTIVIAAAYNISRQKQNGGVFIYLMALVFGLIHGMGFAGTLRFMLAADQQLALPLVAFNAGIEVAQLLLVLLILFLQYLFMKTFMFKIKTWVILASAIAGCFALYLCIIRWPF